MSTLRVSRLRGVPIVDRSDWRIDIDLPEQRVEHSPVLQLILHHVPEGVDNRKPSLGDLPILRKAADHFLREARLVEGDEVLCRDSSGSGHLLRQLVGGQVACGQGFGLVGTVLGNILEPPEEVIEEMNEDFLERWVGVPSILQSLFRGKSEKWKASDGNSLSRYPISSPWGGRNRWTPSPCSARKGVGAPDGSLQAVRGPLRPTGKGALKHRSESGRARSIPGGRLVTHLERHYCHGSWRRPVLWQRGALPFLILVSTILRHRTRDELTARTTLRLMYAFPTPVALSRASVPRIRSLIHELGLSEVKATDLAKAASSTVS